MFPEVLFLVLTIFGEIKYADTAPNIFNPSADTSETLAHDVSINTYLSTEVSATGVVSFTFTSNPDEGVFEKEVTFPTCRIKIIATPTPDSVYTLTVTAVAPDTSMASRTITVTVSSAGPPNNHAPAFQALSGPYKVVKDASIGTEIVTVVATDADTTSPENEITYSVPGGTQFGIDAPSGLITVASTLSYSPAPVELIVTATDGGTPPQSASVTVTVTIQTRPVWTTPAPGSTPTQPMSEAVSSTDDIYTLAATDEDNSGTLTYSVVTPANSKFIVVGDKLRAKPGETFDVDAATAVRQYTLTISVSDGEYSATTDASITVTLTDVNDSPPVFDPSEYSVSFTTDIQNGASIVTVTASDADYTTANNVVTYSLLPADVAVFTIDSSTGVITVDDVSKLSDYVDSLSLVVYAKDSGTPQNTGSATVTITSGSSRATWYTTASIMLCCLTLCSYINVFTK